MKNRLVISTREYFDLNISSCEHGEYKKVVNGYVGNCARGVYVGVGGGVGCVCGGVGCVCVCVSFLFFFLFSDIKSTGNMTYFEPCSADLHSKVFIF